MLSAGRAGKERRTGQPQSEAFERGAVKGFGEARRFLYLHSAALTLLCALQQRNKLSCTNHGVSSAPLAPFAPQVAPSPLPCNSRDPGHPRPLVCFISTTCALAYEEQPAAG